MMFPEFFVALIKGSHVCACFNLYQLRFQLLDASCVEVVALIRRVSLRLVAKMSDRFLEQRIDTKFCVKLGKNASDSCEMLSEEYRGESI
jgi:uncharacterized metal-binding protein